MGGWVGEKETYLDVVKVAGKAVDEEALVALLAPGRHLRAEEGEGDSDWDDLPCFCLGRGGGWVDVGGGTCLGEASTDKR